MYEGICDAIHRELDTLDEKYSSGKNPLNSADLEHIDKMAHALKDLKAVEGMEGYSRRRYRDYDSRDGYDRRY